MALQFAQAVALGPNEIGDDSELWQFVPSATDVDWLNGTQPLPPFHNSTFSIMDMDIYYFGSYLANALHSDKLSSSDSSINYLAESLLEYPANIPEIMANIAESVTIYLRQNNRDSTTASGAVWQQAIIVEIGWPWLILPVSTVLITAALLVAAILSSKSDISAVRSCKSSSLPFLFHGVRDWSHDEWEALYAGNFESIKQMDAVAATMDVRLCKAIGSGTALTRQGSRVDERHADRSTSRQEE